MQLIVLYFAAVFCYFFFPGKGQPSSLIPEADTDNIETDTTWQCIITQNYFPGCKQHVSPLECGKQLWRPYVIAQLVNLPRPLGCRTSASRN